MAAPWSDRGALRLIAIALSDTDTRPTMRLKRIAGILRSAGLDVDNTELAFPKRIFVYHHDALQGAAYLAVDVSKDANEIADGKDVAVYELREVRTKRITHALR